MNAPAAIALRIAPDHPALPGHFPGHPVVPGVVVLERVAAAVRERFHAGIRRLDAKFVRPLLPGEQAQIVLRPDGTRIHFEVAHADGAVLARGVLTVVPPPSAAATTPARAPRRGADR